MSKAPVRYGFDDIDVLLRNETVTKGGRHVTVEPKGFELLVYLIENRDRLVTKQDALDAVWGDAFVTENALSRVVAQLRKALGDDAKDAKYIETVPTRGYRFIADVDTGNAEEGAERLLAVYVVLAAISIASLVSLMHLFSSSDESLPENVASAVQITSSRALDVFPALAPDGSALAYSSDRSGAFEIYVKPLTPGGREIQLTSDGAGNFQAAWSPDGSYIAYHSREKGGIWILPALGGVARQLSEFGSRPAWSPGGEQIAFQSYGLTGVSISSLAAMPPSTIWVGRVEDGRLRQVTRRGRPAGGHGAPSWSRDGSEIRFLSTDVMIAVDEFTGIWSVPSTGGEPERVSKEEFLYYDFTRPAQGEEIYVAARDEGRYELWRVSAASGRGQPRHRPTRVASVAPAAIRHPTTSADGTKLAYTAMSMMSNIAVVRVSPQTHDAVGEPALLTNDTGDRNNFPAFSPDGQTIAYRRMLRGGSSDIWLIDITGENQRPLTVSGGDAKPMWLSDRLVTFGADRAAGAGLWTVELGTGRVELIHERGSDWAMWDLSPDGTIVAFGSRKGGVNNLWTVAIGRDDARQLTFDEEAIAFPAWSPDGREIAAQLYRGSDTHIAVVPASGGEPVQLTNAPGQSWANGWSPDGDEIVFAGLRDGVWNVWWVSRSTGDEKRVTNYVTSHHYVRYPSWSPAGDRIAYEYAEVTGDIWLVDLTP